MYGRNFKENILLSSPNTPKWMNVDYLKHCPYDILDEMEHQFWVTFLDEHLKVLSIQFISWLMIHFSRKIAAITKDTRRRGESC